VYPTITTAVNHFYTGLQCAGAPSVSSNPTQRPACQSSIRIYALPPAPCLLAAARPSPRPSNLPRRRCLTVTTISPLDPHRSTLRAALPSLQGLMYDYTAVISLLTQTWL
jgi:hypothetical protein